MPHTSFVSPSTSMPHRQENIQYNTYTQYDQNVNSWTQQTNNASLPPSLNTSVNTDTRVAMQPSGNDNR